MEQQLQQQRQKEAQRQAVEEARQKSSGLKWAAMAQANPTPVQPVKSLLEIQAEEEKELKKVGEEQCFISVFFIIVMIILMIKIDNDDINADDEIKPSKDFKNNQYFFTCFIMIVITLVAVT